MSQYFNKLSADEENFQQLMEEAKLTNKERSRCSRSWRDQISSFQNGQSGKQNIWNKSFFAGFSEKRMLLV